MNLIRTPVAFAAAALLAINVCAQQAAPPPPVDARPPVDGPAARPPLPGAARGGPVGARMPRIGDEHLNEGGPESTLGGRVARWLVNPNGEVDGLLLEDGTQVAFAPHLSAQLTSAVQVKDTVEITGRRSETSKVVRATAIKSTRSGQSVSVAARDPQGAPPQPRPPGAMTALTAMNASGRIDTLLYTGRGDVNGALLRDGTLVRFPPHAVAQVGDTLKPGAVLYARGYGTRSPQGNALEATALGSNAENARELFAGPGPGAGPGAGPAAGPAAGPDRGPERGARPPAAPMSERPAPPDALPAPMATPAQPAPPAPQAPSATRART